jgi:hypothetical protein
LPVSLSVARAGAIVQLSTSGAQSVFIHIQINVKHAPIIIHGAILFLYHTCTTPSSPIGFLSVQGNEQAKGSVQTPVPPKDEGFITVTQQYDAEVDPILVQLENCPQVNSHSMFLIFVSQLTMHHFGCSLPALYWRQMLGDSSSVRFGPFPRPRCCIFPHQPIFPIDSGSIESIMERIQEVLALSSKAASNEQKLLNGKLSHIEQLCQRLLHNLATQLGALRSVEVRLNDIQHLTAATAQLEKTAANVKDRLDQLDEYLQQIQR